MWWEQKPKQPPGDEQPRNESKVQNEKQFIKDAVEVQSITRRSDGAKVGEFYKIMN